MTLGSVRHAVRIRRPADEVWRLAGDPARLAEWFPGITSSTVEGDVRTVTTGTGLTLREEILVNDPVQRRFQYRITAPIVRDHRGTLDVIDLGDGTTLVVYATDADPRTMALTIGGGTGGALDELRRLLEDEAPGGPVGGTD
jgi:uncharacterized protein YndB with AHSA1/START domain